MNSDKQELFEKSKVEAEGIKIFTNSPELASKIYTNLVDPEGDVYWYIRFNTRLNPESVNKFTMNITETNGYIINAMIAYDDKRNLIVLNPMDMYRQNESYLLNISRNVKSEKGKALGKPVHILFKLLGQDRISEYEVLKADAAVPIPRQKPESVRKKEREELMKYKAFTEGITSPEGAPILPQSSISLNLIPVFFCLMLMLVSFLLGNLTFTIVSIVVTILGLVHLGMQLRRKTVKSDINYALGVRAFNKGYYEKSLELFNKAFQYNPLNEMAEFAIIKTKNYLASRRLEG